MRRHGGGVGAAPAPVPRKHGPGRPWVTVRPHYGGPPFNGLDGTGRAGRKPRARACEEQAVRVPEATVPRPKIAAVERREAPCAKGARAAWRRFRDSASRRSAPSPSGARTEGAPGASKNIPGLRFAAPENPRCRAFVTPAPR